MELLSCRLVSNPSVVITVACASANRSEGQETRQRDENHQAILDWLSPLDFRLKQIDSFNRAQQGTGRWLIEGDTFHQWLNGATRMLWCPGNRKQIKDLLPMGRTDMP